MEVVAFLHARDLAPDANAMREQLPKDLPRLRAVPLSERGPVHQIAPQFMFHRHRIEVRERYAVERCEFRVQSDAPLLAIMKRREQRGE